jgi:hypothetical protein
MKAGTRRTYLIFGLALTSIALGATVLCYWRTLPEETVFTRVPIPPSELRPVGPVATWKIPPKTRSIRWHRTGVRLLESGHALPFRVLHEDMVAGSAPGRFCVSGDTVWLSASDQTSPLTNGRTYELEIHRPAIQGPVLLACSGFVTALLLVGSLHVGIGIPQIIPATKRLFNVFFRSPEVGMHVCRKTGALLLVLATATWIFFPHARFYRGIAIPPEAVEQERDGHFQFKLARWIRRNPTRVNEAVLYEDGKPMRKVSTAAIISPKTRASYVPDLDQICFRSRDESSPVANGRRYLVEVPIITNETAFWCALLLGTAGLVLLGRAAAAEPLPNLPPERSEQV